MWTVRSAYTGREGGRGLPVRGVSGLPLLVEFCNRWTDGEAPSKNGEILELIRHNVALRGLLHGHPGLEHLLRLRGDIVEYFADVGDAFLAADLSVSGSEQGVLVECREFCQRCSPTGDGRLVVKGHWIPAAEQQVACVHHILVRHAYDDVRAVVSRIRFEHSGEPAEVNGHWQLRRVDGMIRHRDDARVHD